MTCFQNSSSTELTGYSQFETLVTFKMNCVCGFPRGERTRRAHFPLELLRKLHDILKMECHSDLKIRQHQVGCFTRHDFPSVINSLHFCRLTLPVSLPDVMCTNLQTFVCYDSKLLDFGEECSSKVAIKHCGEALLLFTTACK